MPLSLIGMILFLGWGVLGLGINHSAASHLQEWALPLLSIPLAGVGAVLLTSGTSRLVARYVPPLETSARPRKHLVGRTGEAVFDITHEFGMASVLAASGDRLQVPCRPVSGTPLILKGQEVLLVSYDPRTRIFEVMPSSLGPAAQLIERPLTQ